MNLNELTAQLAVEDKREQERCLEFALQHDTRFAIWGVQRRPVRVEPQPSPEVPS